MEKMNDVMAAVILSVISFIIGIAAVASAVFFEAWWMTVASVMAFVFSIELYKEARRISREEVIK